MRNRKCYLLHPSGECISFFAFPFLFLLLLFSSALGRPQTKSPNQDQCVACHTSARKLIQITRQIKKLHPEVKKSSLTKGEG